MTSDGHGATSRGGRAPKSQAGSASGLGPALDLKPEHLDQIAEVTPVDIALAKAVWQGHAPTRLSDLLDAEPEP